MRNGWVLLAVVLAGGCDDGPSAEERELAAARDVALVEAANEARPPLKMVTPEPLLLPDIERHDLYGEACSYAPGTSLGVRVIAREADAFVKVDGEVQRLAADPGARELPMHTRSLYAGKDYSLRLQLKGEGEETQGPGDYEGTVSLRDAYGRIVYEGTGLAQCKASAPA